MLQMPLENVMEKKIIKIELTSHDRRTALPLLYFPRLLPFPALSSVHLSDFSVAAGVKTSPEGGGAKAAGHQRLLLVLGNRVFTPVV